MIVIGLGTGRSGTVSLAHLLNAQHDALCFHEMNPACVRFSGTPRPILNSVDEFQAILDGGDSSMLTVDLAHPPSAKAYDELRKMRGLRIIGDVAFYYLSYVEAIAARSPNVRFLCMRRDIDQTVASWDKKSRNLRWRSKYLVDRLSSWICREPFYTSCNYWMEHDGTVWEPDPIWDKCFPKFEAVSKIEAIRKYCEFYYREAERLASGLPDRFRFVETVHMNEPEYQAGILSFAGIASEDRVSLSVHVNQSEPKSQGTTRARFRPQHAS